MRVYAALQTGSLSAAQQAVSMIVGRDTARLDAAGVTRAAVETVAENTSDGVIAPLLYLALGGAPTPFWKTDPVPRLPWKGPIPPIRGKCPEGTKGVGMLARRSRD